MIADDVRVSAYAAALRGLVRPGDRVVEIGAGFGFFSVLAARAGAARVVAVDSNPAVHLGRRVAAANGFADRIAFHHCSAAKLTLDEPADLLIADLRGPTPFAGRSLEALIDARTRLLRPGGTVVAARDTVFVAPSRAPAVFLREVVAAHGKQSVVLDPVERVAYDSPMQCTVDAADLLDEGRACIEIDYRSVDRTDHSGEAEWRMDARCTIEGLAVWFEADLGAGVRFSTTPRGPATAYRQMFVPFRGAVAVEAGDVVRVHLAARQAGGNYVWQWRAWKTAAASGATGLVIEQNSLAEIVVDPSAFPATAPDSRPAAGPPAQALADLILEMDGRRTLAQLAAGLRARHPQLFRTERAAMEFAARSAAQLDRFDRGGA
jgi:SAM-dependent methyltransferase